MKADLCSILETVLTPVYWTILNHWFCVDLANRFTSQQIVLRRRRTAFSGLRGGV